MSQIVPTLPAELILPDGEVVPTRYTATQSQRSFDEAMKDYRESVPDNFWDDPKDWHKFAVRDGRCKRCGTSRAEFEFSRRTKRCKL